MISKEATADALEKLFLKRGFLQSPMLLLYLYFFMRIARGFASFRRSIFQNSSEWLLCACNFQIWLFHTNSILVNISNIINPSLCNVVYHKETIQLICSPYYQIAFYIITIIAKWKVKKMKAKHHKSKQVKLSKRQL